MKISTLAELAGFVCLAVAAWQLHQIAGLITTGVLLCLVGYATEDAQASVALRRVIAPISARRAKRKQKQAEKKA